MTANPVSDRVFIIPTPPDKEIDGIFIPETAVNHPITGKAAFVGPQVSQIKVGDAVVYPQNSGDKITLDNVEYIILKENQIHSIINP